MDKAGDDCRLIILSKVDSTNTYAKDHFADLDDGTVVCAVEQFAGRGRLGRQWLSSPGNSLTATAVLKKILQPFHAGIITGLAGLELARECVPGKMIYFKWPNDIYIREYKIAGILSEGIVCGGKLAGVVSGIGINVNQSASELVVPGNPAASLRMFSGEKFFLEKLHFLLAEKIKKYYIIYQSDFHSVLDSWRAENYLLGENLVLNFPDGSIRIGRFDAISENGGMLMTASNGEHFCFDCGDVRIDTSLINFDLLENKYYNKVFPEGKL